MERASFVSESVLASSELTEIFGGLWNNAVEELEDDSTIALAVLAFDLDIKLAFTRREMGVTGSGCEKSSFGLSTGYQYVRRR